MIHRHPTADSLDAIQPWFRIERAPEYAAREQPFVTTLSELIATLYPAFKLDERFYRRMHADPCLEFYLARPMRPIVGPQGETYIDTQGILGFLITGTSILGQRIGDEGYCHCLAVLPDDRRRGIGSALLNFYFQQHRMKVRTLTKRLHVQLYAAEEKPRLEAAAFLRGYNAEAGGVGTAIHYTTTVNTSNPLTWQFMLHSPFARS